MTNDIKHYHNNGPYIATIMLKNLRRDFKLVLTNVKEQLSEINQDS